MKVTPAVRFDFRFDFRSIASAALLALSGVAAQAQEIPGYPTNWDAYDPREVALLPPYCVYTEMFRMKRVPGGENPDEFARWQSLLGKSTFHHLHHYCWALMKTNRGLFLAREPWLRQSYLGYSIEEFDYVIERAPDDFLLLPEILTKKGENLVRLKKGPVAMMSFERAAELKPDYWPPYAHMSDFYKSTGDMAKAREMLEKGLSFAPDALALKRRLAELGAGKPAGKSLQ
jgi:hypothetical protein